MEHSVDLSAKTFVQAVSPLSARSILKKMKKALRVANNTSGALDLDDLDARLTGFDFNDNDDDEENDEQEHDGEDEEVLEAEVDAANSVGKALLLVKQVCLSCCYNPHWHSYVTLDSCFSSGSGFFHEVLPAG